MKPPSLLLAAALLLWGWQTGLLAFALLMAVVLEAARWIEWRVDFSNSDFNHVVDLCSLLAALGGFYCVLTRDATNQVMTMFQATNFTSRSSAMNSVSQTTFIFFQWFPMILFPAVAAQFYSTRDAVPRSCFLFFARRRLAREGRPQPDRPAINLTYPYFAVVLFSACLANQRNNWFYFVLCAVISGTLWVNRPRRFSTVIWVATLILVVKAGFYGHRGLSEFQTVLENKVANWVSNWARRSGDRNDATTAIGRIGQLKLSGAIVMHVEPEVGPVPSLLRDTMFNRFDSPRWSNSPRPTEAQILPVGDGTSWPVLLRTATNFVRLSSFATRGQSVLALPPGATLIENLAAGEMFTSQAGTLRVTQAPDFLYLRVQHGRGPTSGAPPHKPASDKTISTDLAIPLREHDAVGKIADELGLAGQSGPVAAQVIDRFFAENFKYGSFLPNSLRQIPQGLTPLGFFLLKNRRGHCEYFATATVMLMRQAGIPARYVYGWSVQEPERGTGRFVVRERHAHAWCVYWNEQTRTWVDLDTTSPDWVANERQNASFWEPLTDRWSRAWFGFSKWRWHGATGEWQNYLLLALVGLIGLLAWRILARQRRRRRKGNGLSEAPPTAWAGLDSEFYRLENRLQKMGLERRPGETCGDWLERIEPLTAAPIPAIRELLPLHYRLRFDPHGLTGPERGALQAGVAKWLETARLEPGQRN